MNKAHQNLSHTQKMNKLKLYNQVMSNQTPQWYARKCCQNCKKNSTPIIDKLHMLSNVILDPELTYQYLSNYYHTIR